MGTIGEERDDDTDGYREDNIVVVMVLKSGIVRESHISLELESTAKARQGHVDSLYRQPDSQQ